MNPRTPITELELTASPNLLRAKKREKADAEKPPLTPEQESELEQVNQLIAQALKCCRRGATFRGKKNPAFAILEGLVKVRKTLEARKPDPRSESARILREADELFKRIGTEN